MAYLSLNKNVSLACDLLTGESVEQHVSIPDWVLEHAITVSEAAYPDPVKAREAAEIIIQIFEVGYMNGFIAQDSAGQLALIEAMDMLDEKP